LKRKIHYCLSANIYLKDYEDHFFKLYKSAIDQLPTNQIPKIVIIGRREINENIVTPYLNNLGLSENVVFHDHMPGPDAYWWTNFAKLVDYIALEKRVIAIVPDISEARSELAKANLGEFLKYDKESAVKLGEILLNDNQKMQSNEYCKRYLASNQVKSFIKIFENL